MAGPVFYQPDRERAKRGISPQTLAYIEALEKIAEVGYSLWTLLGQQGEEEMSHNLNDALARVDYMHGEEEGEEQEVGRPRTAEQRE